MLLDSKALASVPQSEEVITDDKQVTKSDQGITGVAGAEQSSTKVGPAAKGAELFNCKHCAGVVHARTHATVVVKNTQTVNARWGRFRVVVHWTSRTVDYIGLSGKGLRRTERKKRPKTSHDEQT